MHFSKVGEQVFPLHLGNISSSFFFFFTSVLYGFIFVILAYLQDFKLWQSFMSIHHWTRRLCFGGGGLIVVQIFWFPLSCRIFHFFTFPFFTQFYFSFLWLKNYFNLLILVCVEVGWQCAAVPVWRSEDNLWALIHSFQREGPRDLTQVISLGSKCLHLLGHLSGLHIT